MKLENQLVSLELAKQLKENGFIQEGLWWWCRGEEDILLGSGDSSIRDVWWIASLELASDYENEDKYVAPTVAELGEALPQGYISYKVGTSWFNGRLTIAHEIRSVNIGVAMDTEANARAKMWLYLKKEGEDTDV